MKISNNFDRWMFDYKEGNLSPEEVEEFEKFLLNHPEYEVDADAWDMAFVQNEPVEYPYAEKLEKKRRVAGWYYWSAAAMLVLLLGSSSLYLFNTTDQLESAVTGEESLSGHHNDRTLPLVDSFNSVNNRAGILFSELTDGVTDSYTNAGNTTGNNNQLAQNQLNAAVSGNVVSGSDPNLANSTHADNLPYANGAKKSQAGLIDLEANKVEGKTHVGKYAGNPDSKGLAFDVTKKTTVKSGSSFSALKKVYHRVERMLGYPVGLTNLRDPELLLPQSTLLSFNSAFAGGMLKPRFEMNYRNQWLGSDQNSSELNVSYDNYSYGIRGGAGILINAQDYGYGRFGDYNVSLLYSPKLVVGRNIVVEPSVKLTMGSMIANGDKLSANSSFEMDRGRVLNTIADNQMNGITTQWYKDYGLGLMINTKWFYAGFSSDNLSRHYENVYGNELYSPAKTPVKLSGIIGTDYESKTKTMTYSPFVAYQQYGNQPELWAGMNYRLGWMTVGGGLSTNKEFTASVGMKFDTFKLVYHYDYTESALTQTRMGSHNVGIRFNAKRKNQRLTH